MEMPSRRPHSYINSFSANDYTVVEGLAGPLHRAKSNKELSTSQPAECSYRYSRSNSQGADFQQAVSTSSPKEDKQFDIQCEIALKELREQLEQIPFKKKYASVTVPLSIKYSTMTSRPRSPKKNNELAEQLEQEKLQEELDQSLFKIREQLNMLTSERVNMEKHMEDLTNDIHEARIQCHNQCQQRFFSTGVRRVRSSTYTPEIKKKRTTPPNQRKAPHEKRASQPALLSPDSCVSSPEYIVQGHKSLGYTDSGYGSLNRRELRVRAASFATSTPNVSLSQGNDYNPTIPELPESPCFSQQTPSHHLRDRVRSNPTLHYVSHTAPRHHRSQSAIVTPIISITSSPDLSTRRRHDGKSYQLSHRNSLPESVMNKIVEDEIDSVSVSDTLSQASLSQLTDEGGSPKSQSSTVIVRRSSLTGQVEHIRRPRKINSFSGATEIELKLKSSYYKTDPEYRVLNTGFKRNRRNRVILPNSIETTV